MPLETTSPSKARGQDFSTIRTNPKARKNNRLKLKLMLPHHKNKAFKMMQAQITSMDLSTLVLSPSSQLEHQTDPPNNLQNVSDKLPYDVRVHTIFNGVNFSHILPFFE